MKVLEPKVTILVLSHKKPTLFDSLFSVEKQTHINDAEVVVIDSGETLRKYPDYYLKFPWFVFYTTGEQKGFRETKCPVSYWTNKAYDLGLIRGEYVSMHYDDDLYYPEFIEKMAGYLDTHPEADAVRCSQNRTKIYADGHTESTPPLVADKEIVGPHMDCVVDGQQVMMRTDVLKRLKAKYGELLPEDPDISSCSHSDGIFFDRMATVINEQKLHFIPETLCEHRNTVYSTYTPTQ